MKVAIPDDDTSYFTKPKDLQRAYDFLNEDDCVSLSVVPYTVPVHRDDVFPYGKEIGMGYYDIAENTELLEYLKEKYKQGKVDILLHGYSHEYQLGATNTDIFIPNNFSKCFFPFGISSFN